MNHRHTIIWVKDALVLGRSDYHYQHEPIQYGWKLGAGHFFVSDRTQTSVWNFERPKVSKEHPTMKPLALVMNAIQNSSRLGDVVFDGFGGSGSTLVACERLGRKCRTIELDPKYCDVILARWERETGRVAMRITPPQP